MQKIKMVWDILKSGKVAASRNRSMGRRKPIAWKTVTAGEVVSVFKYVKRNSAGILRFCVIVLFAGIIALSTMNRRNQYNRMTNNEHVEGRVMLIVAHDVLAHENSRIVLVKLIQRVDVEAVIPLCVMELVQFDETVASGKGSLIARASMLVIEDLLRLGNTAFEQMEPWVWAQNDVRLSEDRILNCAHTCNILNIGAKVFIFTNSDNIKSKAAEKDQRCASPDLLSRWLGL